MNETASLLRRVGDVLDRYTHLPGGEAWTALTLWVLHSWAFSASFATPFLLVISPQKKSGKTRLLETLELLVRDAWRTVGPSQAVLYHELATKQRTLLLDELDALLGGSAERTEAIREVLNAGNRPGAPIARWNAAKGEAEYFDVYSPKALGGIDTGHRIPDTVRDRSLTIHMQRATPVEEQEIERLRPRLVFPKLAPLRDELRAWAEQSHDLLAGAEPHLPEQLDGRAADAVEPLLAIAEQAGEPWVRWARRDLVFLVSEGVDEDPELGTLLLRAIRKVFDEADSDRLGSLELCSAINRDETVPFGEFRGGAGLNFPQATRAGRTPEPEPMGRTGQARA